MTKNVIQDNAMCTGFMGSKSLPMMVSAVPEIAMTKSMSWRRRQVK